MTIAGGALGSEFLPALSLLFPCSFPDPRHACAEAWRSNMLFLQHNRQKSQRGTPSNFFIFPCSQGKSPGSAAQPAHASAR
jgi:hypothetical protein